LYSETDESNHSSASSVDRLDPLQNPLLNQHMGRWAEVYCTTPPEQRDQAVSELLRELEAEQREKATASPQQPTAVRRKFVAAQSVRSLLVRCAACGYDNPPGNAFCGSCRAALRNAHSDSASAAAPVARSVQREYGDVVPTGPWHTQQTNSPAGGFTASQAHEVHHVHSSSDPGANDNDDDVAEPDDSDSFHFSSYSGGSSSPYRPYIGIVLALIIAFLAYRAWLSTKSAADNTQGPSPIPPVTSAPNTAPRTPSAPTTPPPSATPAAQPPQNVTPPVATNPVPPVSAKANNQPQAEATHPAPSTPGSGSAELALAKNYLNGTGGQPRNPSDAIAPLWEAVGKKNAEATELLANAYLTGEGVSKNCDQARVLLDAAARKGRKDAGERLLHLQAFGCQ
jgi:hypothetical protein